MEGNQVEISQCDLIETDSLKARLEDLKQRINKWDMVEKKRLLSILEKVLELQNDKSSEKELKLNLVDLLLNHLKESSSENLQALSQKCERIFSNQAYKKYITDGTFIQSIGIELGQGDCGRVSLGKLYKSDGSWVKVAIKKALNDENKTCLEEAKAMAQFDHINVIKILAFQKIPSRIAMEYMNWGDLDIAVRKHNFTDMDFLNIFYDVASGMEHIATKNYVHRDLWLKNVFINSRKQCKIGDFEYCKYVGDTGGYTNGEGVPKMNYLGVSCIAPEAFKLGIFSTKTDVWAMGLLMWQAYVLAKKQCTLHTNLQILEGLFYLEIGILQKPQRCPSMVHTYMAEKLLILKPEKRHTFTVAKNVLSGFLSATKSACLNDLD